MSSEAVKKMYESHGVPAKGNRVQEGIKKINEMVMLRRQENARQKEVYKKAYRKALDQDIKKKARSDVKRHNKFLEW